MGVIELGSHIADVPEWGHAEETDGQLFRASRTFNGNELKNISAGSKYWIVDFNVPVSSTKSHFILPTHAIFQYQNGLGQAPFTTSSMQGQHLGFFWDLGHLVGGNSHRLNIQTYFQNVTQAYSYDIAQIKFGNFTVHSAAHGSNITFGRTSSSGFIAVDGHNWKYLRLKVDLIYRYVEI